jgi:1-phosphofructokinase family hexose kinase
VDHVILTVTMNVALDRSLRVPNFQVGHRHRASDAFAQAGGKGINVARALKTLHVPVVATGLAGGQTGTRILEELAGESILNDFVRIEGESRTSTAVVDPAGGTLTEINEWGPAVRPEELETLLEKLDYLTQGAQLVVFAGSLPRAVEDDFYAEAIRELTRKGVPAALDCDGEPLRLGLEAEPALVSPNQREAEAVVGHEFHDDEDFVFALDQIADAGARDVIITTETGCFALVHEDKLARRYRVVSPRVEPVSRVGSGDTLLAAFLAARGAGRAVEDQLRAAVGAGAASTFELGAGRFDPRQASRLAAAVEVTELAPVAESPA